MTVNASKGTASDLPHFRATYMVTQTEALHRIHSLNHYQCKSMGARWCRLFPEFNGSLYQRLCCIRAEYFYFHQGYFPNYNLPKMAIFVRLPFLLCCFLCYFIIDTYYAHYSPRYTPPWENRFAGYNANVTSQCVRPSAPEGT